MLAHNNEFLDRFKALKENILDLESTMSDKEWFQLASSYGQVIRTIELRCVKEQIKIKLNYDERSEEDIRFTSKVVNFALSKGYPFLDAIIKFSADEKIGGGVIIYRYSTLWEIMEKTGLLDKYKNEIY
jgi:hypothetical protein